MELYFDNGSVPHSWLRNAEVAHQRFVHVGYQHNRWYQRYLGSKIPQQIIPFRYVSLVICFVSFGFTVFNNVTAVTALLHLIFVTAKGTDGNSFQKYNCNSRFLSVVSKPSSDTSHSAIYSIVP